MITSNSILTSLYIIFIFSIPFENVKIGFGDVNIRLYQVLLLIITLLVLPTFFKAKDRLPNLTIQSWLNVPTLLLLFMGSNVIGGLINNSNNLKQTLVKILILITYYILFLLVFLFINSKERLDRVIKTILWSALVIGLAGLYQAIAFKINLPTFEVMPGRVNSFFPEPDWLSVWVAFTFGILLPLLYFKKTLRCRALVASLSLLSYITLLLSVSRSGWVATLMITTLFFLLIWLNKQNSIKSISGLAIITITLFGLTIGIIRLFNLTPFSLQDRALSIISKNQQHQVAVDPQGAEITLRSEQVDSYRQKNDTTVITKDVPDINITSRIDSYKNNTDIIKDHPLIGIGPAGLEQMAGKGVNANNIFIGIMISSGSVGLFFFLITLGLLIYQSFRLIRQNSQYGFIILLPLLAIFTANLFNDGLYLAFLWLFLGLAAKIPLIINQKD